MSNGDVVRLDWGEMAEACLCGIWRQLGNLKKGRQEAHSPPESGAWQRHIEGALVERAFAKYLGVYHSGAFEFRGLDVGEFQVRGTGLHNGRLILHETDADADVFVLLTGEYGVYTVRGAIRGADGKRPEFWCDPAGGRPAYFVPQSELAQVHELAKVAA